MENSKANQLERVDDVLSEYKIILLVPLVKVQSSSLTHQSQLQLSHRGTYEHVRANLFDYGIPLVPGAGLPLRQEITAWCNNDANKYQTSLFMQALTIFKQVPVNQRLSFFQIAGVPDLYVRYIVLHTKLSRHSLLSLSGMERRERRSSARQINRFILAHNRVTFPTWHRPYMLL